MESLMKPTRSLKHTKSLQKLPFVQPIHIRTKITDVLLRNNRTPILLFENSQYFYLGDCIKCMD